MDDSNLEKFFPHKLNGRAKLTINDADLQMEFKEKIPEIVKIDFQGIYKKYQKNYTNDLQEMPGESTSVMNEVEEAYLSMRNIHDQLVKVYNEFLVSRSKRK